MMIRINHYQQRLASLLAAHKHRAICAVSGPLFGQVRQLLGSSPRRSGSSSSSSCGSRTQSPHQDKRLLSCASSSQELIDRCSRHIVSSPFPPIAGGPYKPLYEHITENWKQQHHGGGAGYLSDKVAMVDYTTGLSRTFSDYYTTATRLAGTLRQDMGITENDCVAMYCPNHVDYLPVALAVSLTGARMTPVNPLYTEQELCTLLERSKSSILVAHWSKLAVALQAVRKTESVQHVIVITDNGEPIPEGTMNLQSLILDDIINETPPNVQRTTHTHPFLLPYSSGTTGLPKACCLTHDNIVANLLQLDAVEGISFPPEHKLISPLPFFHIYGFTVSLLYPAWRGNTVITNSGRFDLEQYCAMVQEHKPERSHLVPPILLGLAKHPIVDQYDMSSLEAIIVGAAPTSLETERAVEERIGCIVKQAWGMSELSPLGTWNSDYNIKSGSVGPLISSTVGKVVDDEGHSLGPNERGELIIKGPQVMLGYWQEPERTADCLSTTSGWLRTGDVVYYDEDEFFYVVDRVKELIKVSGYPVAPAELEALLLTHDAVADAAVIQVPHDVKGEVPRAYVVLKDDAAASDKDIYEWVKERVAPYKRLEGGVVFRDTIPKSASGKILRRHLRDEVKAEMEEEQTVQPA